MIWKVSHFSLEQYLSFLFSLRGDLSKWTKWTCLFVACFSSPSFTPADHVNDHGNHLADNNEHTMETAGSTSSMEPHLRTPSNGNVNLIYVWNFFLSGNKQNNQSSIGKGVWFSLNFCRNALWLESCWTSSKA